MVDAEVLTRFRDGDGNAVRAVYEDYGRLVYAVSHRVLGDRSLAEEATQITFVQAWRAAGSFDVDRDPGPWLATIARRAAIDVYRREQRRTHIALDEVPASDPAIVSLPPGLDNVYDVWEVRRAVDDLPADEREIVKLQHFEGHTHAAIAEQLGLPVGTVKSRSFRAHQRLARRLGHLRDQPEGNQSALPDVENTGEVRS